MYSTASLLIFNKGECLVSSLSAGGTRLHWANIYIVVVMQALNVSYVA